MDNDNNNSDDFLIPEEDTIPAIIDSLDPEAPLVQRLKEGAGPEVTALLDELLKEAGLSAEAIEWLEDEEQVDEIMDMVESLAVGENMETKEEIVEEIRRVFEV